MPTTIGAVYSDIYTCHIVMKRYSTTLKDYLLDESIGYTKVQSIALQCVDLLSLLFSYFKIVHSDIKGNNVFVDLSVPSNPLLILGDYGVANALSDDICLATKPKREVRKAFDGSQVMWEKKTYHCNAKANTTRR